MQTTQRKVKEIPECQSLQPSSTTKHGKQYEYWHVTAGSICTPPTQSSAVPEKAQKYLKASFLLALGAKDD
jgi:hypothetical protein